MKRKITFLIAAIAAIMLITQPRMVVGQTKTEGDILAELEGTGSSYANRFTYEDDYDVTWVVSTCYDGYLGTNKAANHNLVKPTADDLPVVKAVNADVTTNSTGYYFYYTTTPIANVGSLVFSYSANSGYSSATAYVVVGDAVATSGGATYTQIALSSTSATAQGASLGTSGTFTYTFNQTQTAARYYGFVIETSSYKRMTGGTITLKEGPASSGPFYVTYDGNNKTSGSVPTDATAYAKDATVTVKTNSGSLARTGYTFGGWNTKADGSGTTYPAVEPLGTFTITADTRLYAKWNPISYGITKSIGANGSVAVKIGESVVTEAGTGLTVTLTTTPDANFLLNTLTVTNNSTSETVTLTPTVSSSVNTYTFTMPASAVTVSATFKQHIAYDIDFENNTSSYTDWTFTTMTSNQSGSIDAHRGSKYGTTGGSGTASIETKNAIKYPQSITCYVSKQTTNTNSSTWYFQVKEGDNAWATVSSRDATNMSKGEWVEFSADLSSYSNVKVRIYYSGSTAVRNIDDLSLTYLPVNNSNELTTDLIVAQGESASATTLIIPSDKSVTIAGTMTVNNLTNDIAANLIIEDGGQLIVHNSGVQATIKKALPSGSSKATNWTTIASPVKNISIGDTDEDGDVLHLKDVDFALYRLNEATPEWENYKNTAYHNGGADDFETLEAGRGYLYSRNELATLEYVGAVNGDDYTEYSLTKSSNDNAGFHLIGNPYSHDIYKGEAENGYAIPNSPEDGTSGYVLADGFYRLKNGTSWETKLDDGTKIESGEGILVQATTAGTLSIYNSDTKPAPAKGRANNDNIMFTVANSQYDDVAYALFKKGVGLTKINHRNENVPMIYINQDGEDFAIATMSDDTKSFNLNFKAMTTGMYKLGLKPEGNFTYIHVIDKLTGEDIDMLLEGEYSFIGSPKDSENRFIVILGYMPNGNDDSNDIFAYQSGSEIYVTGSGELQIFDVTGRRVMTTTINGSESISIPAQGVYIFRLNEKVQKIVVR